MSESDQFRQYAEEAMRWATESKTGTEEHTLIELACIWAQAAAESAKPWPSIVGPRKAATVGASLDCLTQSLRVPKRIKSRQFQQSHFQPARYKQERAIGLWRDVLGILECDGHHIPPFGDVKPCLGKASWTAQPSGCRSGIRRRAASCRPP
jgi:hypothetical protein